MRIVHLIAGELAGGAARGAYGLHLALRELGITSAVLGNCRHDLGDKSVTSLASSSMSKVGFALRARLDSLPARLYRNRQSHIFSAGFVGANFKKYDEYKSADIVHLHWVNGLVAVRALRKIDKPVIWTMRDMWPMTGGCHYSLNCDRYTSGCGRCPQLDSQHSADLSRVVVRNKQKSIPRRLMLVGVSQWLSDCARRSAVFASVPVETISNNVDTVDFSPIDRNVARRALRLPVDGNIVLVGAQRVGDFYKGYGLVLEALNCLKEENFRVLLFGRIEANDLTGLHAKHTSLGFLSDLSSLRLAYSAADVFVAPSQEEAFPKTVVEAMACGTPVVCFNATGPRDIVEHEVTGYKAVPFDPADLANGIQWVLNQPAEAKEALNRRARERAVRCFDSRVIAKQYQDLYMRVGL